MCHCQYRLSKLSSAGSLSQSLAFPVYLTELSYFGMCHHIGGSCGDTPAVALTFYKIGKDTEAERQLSGLILN